jgi:hypothetical protein
MADQEVISLREACLALCGEFLNTEVSRGLILVGAFCYYTWAENIKHFE